MAADERKGFGVRVDGDPHHWIVRIPAKRDGQIEIFEDYGCNGWASHMYEPVLRAVVNRNAWRAIADPMRAYLNTRLKKHGFKSSKFTIGDNPIERVLGTEMCFLAWVVDDVSEADAREAFTSFISYRPEEIHWMYQCANRNRDLSRPACGWRLAFKYALMPSRSPQKVSSCRQLEMNLREAA